MRVDQMLMQAGWVSAKNEMLELQADCTTTHQVMAALASPKQHDPTKVVHLNPLTPAEYLTVIVLPVSSI